MKPKSRPLKKQVFTFSNFLYRVAGFFLLLVAIANVIFNVISLMQVRYSYGFGFASTSYLFMYFHESIFNVSLRLTLIVLISFFFSGFLTFISTEVNKYKLKYLVGAFVAYMIDFLFLVIPLFPYQLSTLELEFSFVLHTSVLGLLFIIIIILFIKTHLDNVRASNKPKNKEEINRWFLIDYHRSLW